MLFALILVLAGLLLLYYGAESLVTGSSRLALSYGVRPLVVGLTVVAFATSMPEMMVSLLAAFKGSAAIAAGNIVGSNIANIGLILGSAALLAPIAVARRTLTREVPMMVLASLLVYLLAADGLLGFFDGLLLFLCLLGFLGYCLVTARQAEVLEGEACSVAVARTTAERRHDLGLILLGMLGLGGGAELMVRGAVVIATRFGVSEVVIGLSIVALGTSLPELAASMVSAWKGEMDISVGNVIGSNIFNVLFVLGVCPMIRPLDVAPRLLQIDFPVMLGFCLLLPAVLLLPPRHQLDRRRGGLLLGAYLLFIVTLFRMP